MSSININKDFLSDVYDYIKGDVLFEGNSTSATLSTSAKNYKTLKVYYSKARPLQGCVPIDLTDGIGRGDAIYMFHVYPDNWSQILVAEINVNDTSISLVYGGYANINTDRTLSQGNNDELRINKVIGYKY